jgi:hypothetical protein
MNFNFYPIYWLADEASDEPFDLTRLPFDIAEDVRIEAVSDRFRDDAFTLWASGVGSIVVDELERVRFALVHRYSPAPIFDDRQLIGETQRSAASQNVVRTLAACLRLVRPMRQNALRIHGSVRGEDGSFDVRGFDLPNFIEVPEVQKLFMFRPDQ